MLTGATLEIIPLPTGEFIQASWYSIGTTMSANGAVVAGNIGGGSGGSTLRTWQWKNGTLIQFPDSTG